jgi:hypothetical protein
MQDISELRKSGEWHEHDPAEPESGNWSIPVEDKA